MNLAIIPTRDGSKQIPGKNIKAFAGKPLFADSIEAAKNHGLFEQIWVSTDVADATIRYGAKVPFLRLAELSDDFVGTGPVTKHALKFSLSQGIQADYRCCIYATARFLQANYLQEALQTLQSDKKVLCIFMLQCNGVAPIYSEFIGKRSQDLSEAFHDAGQFYWSSIEVLLSNKLMFSEHSYLIVLPRHLVKAIDTYEDWQSAELIYQAYMQKTNLITGNFHD